MVDGVLSGVCGITCYGSGLVYCRSPSSEGVTCLCRCLRQDGADKSAVRLLLTNHILLTVVRSEGDSVSVDSACKRCLEGYIAGDESLGCESLFAVLPACKCVGVLGSGSLLGSGRCGDSASTLYIGQFSAFYLCTVLVNEGDGEEFLFELCTYSDIAARHSELIVGYGNVVCTVLHAQCLKLVAVVGRCDGESDFSSFDTSQRCSSNCTVLNTIGNGYGVLLLREGYRRKLNSIVVVYYCNNIIDFGTH